MGTATLIISNKEMNNIMKIVKSLVDSGIFFRYFGVSKRIKKEIKENKGGFLGLLGASSLENMLARKGAIREDEGEIKAGEILDTFSSFN